MNGGSYFQLFYVICIIDKVNLTYFLSITWVCLLQHPSRRKGVGSTRRTTGVAHTQQWQIITNILMKGLQKLGHHSFICLFFSEYGKASCQKPHSCFEISFTDSIISFSSFFVFRHSIERWRHKIIIPSSAKVLYSSPITINHAFLLLSPQSFYNLSKESMFSMKASLRSTPTSRRKSMRSITIKLERWTIKSPSHILYFHSWNEIFHPIR